MLFQHKRTKWVKLCMLIMDLLAFEAHQNSFASCKGSGNVGSELCDLLSGSLTAWCFNLEREEFASTPQA